MCLKMHQISFSKNINGAVKEGLCNTLQMIEADDSTYLGLPNMLGRLISQAGRKVLIKSVEQTLATYFMNVFLLPLDTTNDINKC